MRKGFALGIAAVVLAGCASTGTGAVAAGGIEAPSRARSRSQSVISEVEIAEQSGVSIAYDLINRVRPAFFRTGVAGLSGESGAPVLRVDAAPALDISDLRNIDIRNPNGDSLPYG
ncbi:MAG: hypothetical protein ABI910_09030 [Gemmatimonadota bacterium]